MNPKTITDLSSFQWRDRYGVFHDPKQMKTRHIFYTLRMIWNHCAPDNLKLRPYQKYNFNSFYTTEYMIRAVKSLIEELKTRDNIEIYIPDIIKMNDRIVPWHKHLMNRSKNGTNTNRHQIEN